MIRTTTPSRARRRWQRPLAVLAVTGFGLLAGAGTALAHVSVTPGTAAPGSYTTLSFRVPNESDTASTTKLEIQIPADTPFPTVSAKLAPGWTIDVLTSTLPTTVTQGSFTLDEAVTSVSFTADGAGVGPHEFTTFDLLVGPVPEIGSIAFAVVQTYSDGTVVRWDEPTPAGGEEPEHPAPVLTVAGEPVTGGDDQSATVTASPDATTATGPAESSDTMARVIGVAGVILGLIGLSIGVGSTRNARRVPPHRPDPTGADQTGEK